MFAVRNKIRSTDVFNIRNSSVLQFSTKLPISEKCPFSGNNQPKEPLYDTEEDYAKARPFSQIPGPSLFQLLWHSVIPNGKYKDLMKIHQILNEEYGNIVKIPAIAMKSPIVVVYDPEKVEKVFRNEGQWPNRFGFDFVAEFREKLRPEVFQGISGLVNDQGQQWQDTRTKVNPILMQPKNVTRYVAPVDKISQEFVNRIRMIRDDKGEVPADFANEMNKWSLESIAYIALDQRLGLMTDTNPDSEGQKLIEHVHDFFQFSYDLGVKVQMSYKKSEAQMNSCLSGMTDIIVSLVNKSIAEIECNPKSSPDEESVLEKLLKIDKRVAIVMALDMLIAGVDTTSNSVLSLLNLLAQNPDKQEILREEIRRKLPEKDSPLTPEIMRNLPYLRACQKETQRMLPVVLGNIRKCPKDIVLGGYLVPKEYYVSTSGWVIAMKEENFKRANEFIPERFLKEGGENDLKGSSPFALLPFGFGPRMCIGKRLADLEVESLMCRIIRNFKVEWHYPEIKYTNNLLYMPTGDLKFRFRDLNN